MFYLIIGYRNIIKNFRRSLITMIPVMIGMISCLLTQGFFSWNLAQLRESLIHGAIGHYQLYLKGYAKFGGDNPYQYLIKDPTPVLRELRNIPEVKLVTTRMAFNGILSSGDKSAVIIGEAGIPEAEQKIAAVSTLIAGTNLSSAQPDGIIIGDGVARKLSAKIGAVLTLIGTGKDGSINAVDLEVTGISRRGVPDLDNITVTASLRVIQNLLDIDGSVQKMVVLVGNTRDAKKILPRIKLISNKYRLEYQSWESLSEFYRSVKLLDDLIFYIIISIVLAVVIFTISNTINMSINDRFREIGTIRALGTRRSQVSFLFIVESTLLGLGGSLFGLIFGYFFIGFTEIIGGLPVMINGAEGQKLIHVFFQPDLAMAAICMGLFSAVALLASIIPSRRAANISITQALHWI